jgi:HD-GYP domain-containing protein (c-di-GMP phosphodiesterase class II)
MEVLIDDNRDTFQQSEEITERIKKLSGIWFNPKIVDAFLEISRYKIFWIALAPEFVDDILNEFTPQDNRKLTIDHMIEVASIFAQVIDYKSHHTRDHGVQVTEISVKMGKAMGWSKTDLKRLWIAALLHDMGKLSIPDEILNKTSQLTPNEFAIIKRHPYFSFQILSSIPGFGEIAEWLLYHHETLNGSGYPFGVDAENIPTGARIISVADKFVALTEDRPYRPRMSYKKAIEILDEDANRQVIDRKVLNLLKMLLAGKL